MSAPTYDAQGSKFLRAQSQNFPLVVDALAFRDNMKSLVPMQAKHIEIFNANEAKKLREPGGLMHLPDDADPAYGEYEMERPHTYMHPGLVPILVSSGPVTSFETCRHFSCVTETPLAGEDLHWIAKVFKEHLSPRHGTLSVAEDAASSVAILRGYLSSFAMHPVIKSFSCSVTTAPISLLSAHRIDDSTNHDTEGDTVFLCQRYLKGGTISVSGHGALETRGPGIAPAPARQLCHALAHWTYQHSESRGVVLSMKAKVFMSEATVFGCKWFGEDDIEYGDFKIDHVCCALCHDLDLYSLQPLE